MYKFLHIELLFTITIYASVTNGWNGYTNLNYDCGPYGFTCGRNNRLRLCDETKPIGPTFICPTGTFCNEESTNVCEDLINHIDPSLTRRLRCHRNERIANPNVPGCKGYILCVPSGSRFQGINFKCSGNTIFNGITRTCTSPSKYKCPLGNTTRSGPELFGDERRDEENRPFSSSSNFIGHRPSSIECKNYKLRVTENSTPSQAAYFCPPRPPKGRDTVRCTIFSNNFCITLDRDDDDQYTDSSPFRKPRT